MCEIYKTDLIGKEIAKNWLITMRKMTIIDKQIGPQRIEKILVKKKSNIKQQIYVILYLNKCLFMFLREKAQFERIGKMKEQR